MFTGTFLIQSFFSGVSAGILSRSWVLICCEAACLSLAVLWNDIRMADIYIYICEKYTVQFASVGLAQARPD